MIFAKFTNKCYNNYKSMNTQTMQSSGKIVSVRTLEREMLIAGLVWVILGGICVVAANAWAATI